MVDPHVRASKLPVTQISVADTVTTVFTAVLNTELTHILLYGTGTTDLEVKVHHVENDAVSPGVVSDMFAVRSPSTGITRRRGETLQAECSVADALKITLYGITENTAPLTRY